MANNSRDSFDLHFVQNMKHYVSVRLQQGVPLVDADWNEREDIRKYELQAYLKWFVGNGVPRGNDGFAISAITGSGSINNFLIRGGDETVNNPGRCLVDGMDVIIPKDMKYQDQALFKNVDLANALGVDVLPGLTTLPSSSLNRTRTDTVYLDVWEREVIDSVSPELGGDPDLIDEQIGVPTCTRLKRDWVVRVAEHPTVVPDNDDVHSYYSIANIIRRRGEDEIIEEDIIDLRRKDIYASNPDNFEQITADAFGQGYTLDNDGQPNLQVSLRDAINSLLKQELPSTDVQLVKNSAMLVDTTKDSNGNLWIAWLTKNVGTSELHFSRYIIGKYDLVLDVEDRVSDQIDWDFIVEPADPPNHPEESYHPDDDMPFILADQSGGAWFFWTSSLNGVPQTWCRHHTGSDWTDAEEIPFDAALPAGENLLSAKRPYALQTNNGDVWLLREIITELGGGGGPTTATHIGYNTKLGANPWSVGTIFSIQPPGVTPPYSIMPQRDVRPVAIEGRKNNYVRIFWVIKCVQDPSPNYPPRYYQDIWTAFFDPTDSTWKGYRAVRSREFSDLKDYPTMRQLYPVRYGDEKASILYTNEKLNSTGGSRVDYCFIYEDDAGVYWRRIKVIDGDWPGIVPFLSKKLIFSNAGYSGNFDVWYKVLNEDNSLSQPIRVEGLPVHNGRPSVVTDDAGQPLIIYINLDLEDVENDPEVMNMAHWNIITKRLITSI